MKHFKYLLYGFFILGLWVLIYSKSLLSLYIGIELVSLTAISLSEFSRFPSLVGLFASVLMLYGLSFLYGISGSLHFSVIQTNLSSGFTDPFLLYFITFCLLIGVSIKMIMVPFHGSKNLAFLTTALPLAGFAILTRFFYFIFSNINKNNQWETLPNFHWPIVILTFSILTMTWGNLLAIQAYRKDNIKKLFLSSTIIHGGWILYGFSFLSQDGLLGSTAYLILFVLMNLGSWLVLDHVDSLRGLMWRSRFVGLIGVILVISQMGLPPFSLFIAKLNLLSLGIQSGQTVATVLMSLNYLFTFLIFFGLLRQIVLRPKTNISHQIFVPKRILFILIAAPLLLIGLGVQWDVFLDLIRQLIKL